MQGVWPVSSLLLCLGLRALAMLAQPNVASSSCCPKLTTAYYCEAAPGGFHPSRLIATKESRDLALAVEQEGLLEIIVEHLTESLDVWELKPADGVTEDTGGRPSLAEELMVRVQKLRERPESVFEMLAPEEESSERSLSLAARRADLRFDHVALPAFEIGDSERMRPARIQASATPPKEADRVSQTRMARTTTKKKGSWGRWKELGAADYCGTPPAQCTTKVAVSIVDSGADKSVCNPLETASGTVCTGDTRNTVLGGDDGIYIRNHGHLVLEHVRAGRQAANAEGTLRLDSWKAFDASGEKIGMKKPVPCAFEATLIETIGKAALDTVAFNFSLWLPGPASDWTLLAEEIEKHPTQAFVFAAGNQGKDLACCPSQQAAAFLMDSTRHPLENIFVIGGHDSSNKLELGSNFGSSVDITAHSNLQVKGTSGAAPRFALATALVASKCGVGGANAAQWLVKEGKCLLGANCTVPRSGLLPDKRVEIPATGCP